MYFENTDFVVVTNLYMIIAFKNVSVQTMVNGKKETTECKEILFKNTMHFGRQLVRC